MNKALTAVVIIAVLFIVGSLFFFVTQKTTDSSANSQYVPSDQNTQTQTETNNNANANTNPQANTFQVSIKIFAFTPSTLTIKSGDTVVWTNEDGTGHTVTSDSGTELASSTLGSQKTYSHTFTVPGTYAYHCALHGAMKGTIIVE